MDELLPGILFLLRNVCMQLIEETEFLVSNSLRKSLVGFLHHAALFLVYFCLLLNLLILLGEDKISFMMLYPPAWLYSFVIFSNKVQRIILFPNTFFLT